jgi:hypothetical protein
MTQRGYDLAVRGSDRRPCSATRTTPTSSTTFRRADPNAGRTGTPGLEGEIERGGTDGSPSWTHIAGAGFEPATSGL